MLKNLKIPYWTVPFILLFVLIIAFGLLIPDLGFYWDDWAKTLVDKIFGPSGYWDYYAEDRPLSGWTHIVLNMVLGDKPVNWHIFTLIMRWLSAWGLWVCIIGIWPGKKKQAVLSAILFSVFPVFTLQSIPVTFHQQWMQYVLYFVSLGCMIYAFRSPKHKILLSSISVLTLLVQLSITEYFAPLEFLRPFVLWYLIDRDQGFNKKRLIKVLKNWLPYLIVILAYLAWRLFFIKLPGDDPYRPDILYNIFSQPLSTISVLLKTVVKDTLYVLISNWSKVFELGLNDMNTKFVFLTWILGILAAFIVIVYMSMLDTQSEENDIDNKNTWVLQAGLIGVIAVLLGCVPAWISGRQVIFDYHSNRYAMAAMFGASILTVAFIEWLSNKFLQKTVFVGILLAMAIGFHLRTGDEYREIWTNQKDFYWQLYWRAPYIEPATAIITEDELFPNQGLFSTSSAINLLYPQPENREHLAYWVYSLRPRYANTTTEPLQLHFETQFRTLTYLGDTPDSILVYYYPGRSNCMWLVNEDDQYNPNMPELTRRMNYLSNLNRIEREPLGEDFPSTSMFGKEPSHEWCYYFQKADLAKQFGEWEKVAEYANVVSDMGYTPFTQGSDYSNEWIPFIEGYAHLDEWAYAESLTLDNYEQQPEASQMLCNLWERIDTEVSDSTGKQESVDRVLAALNCE